MSTSIQPYQEPVSRSLYDFEAEQSVLGAMLMDNGAAQVAHEMLTPEDFYSLPHKNIFRALCALLDKSESLDHVVLSSYLNENGLLADCGGPTYQIALIEACPSSANIYSYASTVKELAIRRTIVDSARQLADVAYNVPVEHLGGFAQSIANRASEATRNAASGRQLLPIGELRALPPPQWLIQRFLVAGTTSLFTADSGSYKSFFALHAAYCVAHSLPFFDLQVQNDKGTVVYVAGEGFGGLRARSIAWDLHHGRDAPDNLYIWSGAVQIADRNEVALILRTLDQSGLSPSLLIFDTLNRCAENLDENSARDMGSFCGGLKRIVEKTGAHAMVVHHNNANGRSRGSTALPGAFDTRLNAKRDGDTITLTCQKQKDGAAEFKPFALEARIVDIGETDEFGEAITSLVLEKSDLPVPTDDKATPPQNRETATRRARILDVHSKVMEEYSDGAKFGTLLQQCIEEGVYGQFDFHDRKAKQYGNAKSKFGDDMEVLQKNGMLRRVPFGEDKHGKELYVYVRAKS